MILVPFLERHAQAARVLRIVGIESLRKRLRQHRQTHKRPAVRHKVQPFGMVTGRWTCAYSFAMPLWHQERHRHREHPGLRIGIAGTDRRRLPRNFVGDRVGSGPEEVTIAFELFPLRVAEQGQLLVILAPPARARWPA